MAGINRKRLHNTIFALLLLGAGGSLLAGLYSGLIRLGVLFPTALELNALSHGPLMINGFLATLISLERAAAFEKGWTFIPPVAFALSTMLTLCSHLVTGGFFLLAGSLIFLLVLLHLYRIQPASHHLVMVLGAGSLLAGNLLLLAGFPLFQLVLWWLAFPVLTILGERLELNRIMRPPARAVTLFLALIFLWTISIAGYHFLPAPAWALFCMSLILMSLWMIRYDVARRTIRAAEWTRYSAWSLLTGYGWLIAAGLFGLRLGVLVPAGPSYDAFLHMLFVGFVFSMIFAHAAIIIPSLTGQIVPWHPLFYVPLLLLHLFLLMRVVGDLFWLESLRRLGSYGNAAAILLFLGGIATQLMRQFSFRRTPA